MQVCHYFCVTNFWLYNMAASSASFKYISSKCLQNDKLISLIRKHPLLYNTELKEYKDNQLKTIIWRNIALECCLKGGKSIIVQLVSQ